MHSMRGPGGRRQSGGVRPDSFSKPRSAILLRIGKYLLRFKWLLLVAFGLTVASNSFALIGPALAGKAIDAIGTAQGGVDMPGVLHYALLMAIFYLASSIFGYLLSVLMVYISRNVTRAMRKDLFSRIAEMPVGFFDTHPIGDVLSRIFYDVDTINTSLSSDVVQVLTSVITIVGSLALMISISPVLVLVFLVTVPMAVLITRFITKRTQPLFRKRSRKMGELNDYSEEIISGLKTLKAYHQEHNTVADFDVLNEQVVDAYYKSEYFSSTTGPSVNFINNLSMSLISVFGVLLYLGGGITIGNISAFVFYSRKFSGPINEIANIYGELQSALAAADRVFSLLDEPVEIPDEKDAEPLTGVQGDVELNDVHFGYMENKPVLKDLSFRAGRGSLIAIVGPTGAGKTTLINLLMRFYDVQNGSITVDGHPVKGVTRDSLRRAYSMVLQDTWLFHGTVYDNIAYAKPGATMDEVVAVAKAAHIHHFIMGLPEGYQTILSDDGTNISKGQKQLLTIARAMLVDAKMLILDEATSNVDTHTEVRIQQAMRLLMKDKTCFIVAHRLSTIKNADLILAVKDGNVVESGTHEELMAKHGFYRELYDAQFS